MRNSVSAQLGGFLLPMRLLEVLCILCCLCPSSRAVVSRTQASAAQEKRAKAPATDDDLLEPPWLLNGASRKFLPNIAEDAAERPSPSRPLVPQPGSKHRPRMLNAHHMQHLENATAETERATAETERRATESVEDGGENGASVIRDLMRDYDPSEAPPVDERGRVPVALAFRANQLLEFDHVQQTLSVQGWVRTYWYDPRLAFDGSPALKGAAAQEGWDSARDFLTVDSHKLWRPDITLYNAVDLNFNENCAESKAFLADRSGGTVQTEDGPLRWNVFWSQSCVLHSRCAAELKWYPFDNNTCPLHFSPYTDNFIEMHVAEEKVNSEISVPEFQVSVSLADTTIEKEPFAIVGKPVPWEVVTIRLRLLRHGQYYVINFVGPIIMLIMLAWVGFWIPPQASDRVAFNITLLLTLMAVNFITADKRPATHEDMWLDRFQTSTMLMIVGATFYSVLAYHMQPPEDWPEERRKIQIERCAFREKVARIVFPSVAIGYLGYLFWQLHTETQEEEYSVTAYLTFVVMGIVAVCLCVTACGAEDAFARLRGDTRSDA